MGDRLYDWYQREGEYLRGFLFGLVVLDIFMFLIHGLTDKTGEAYSLMTLTLTVPLFAVAVLEKMYGDQVEAEAHH